MNESRRQYLLRKIQQNCSDKPARLASWANDDHFMLKLESIMQQGFLITNDLVLGVMRERYLYWENAHNSLGVKSPVPFNDMRRSISFLERASFEALQDSKLEYNSSSAV